MRKRSEIGDHGAPVTTGYDGGPPTFSGSLVEDAYSLIDGTESGPQRRSVGQEAGGISTSNTLAGNPTRESQLQARAERRPDRRALSQLVSTWDERPMLMLTKLPGSVEPRAQMKAMSMPVHVPNDISFWLIWRVSSS